ncbi:hypothetical protein YC2023_053112 [Brassica napus]
MMCLKLMNYDHCFSIEVLKIYDFGGRVESLIFNDKVMMIWSMKIYKKRGSP